MKDCVRFAPIIGSREDELTPGEAKALAAHLAECGTCRASAADLAATAGLVAEGLMARANARDFAPFVDQVMARVAGPVHVRPFDSGAAERPLRSGRTGARGVLAWLAHHRRAAAAALVPVLAALAVIVYVRLDGGRNRIALLELSSEGEVSTVLQTADGPVVLLAGESET
jgi:anti-sigma factor RsiW